MRKLMWFAIGFTISMVLGTYVLVPQWYLAAVGISAIVLVVLLLCLLSLSQMRIPTMVVFSCTLGFLWIIGFDALYLSTARRFDNQTVSVTITATEYSDETDYGGVVKGYVELDGKHFAVLAYHDEESMLSPGDSLNGSFLLRCTLPGGYQASTYNRSNGIFLTARPRGELQVMQAEQLPWYGIPAWLHRQIVGQIHRMFPDDTAGFAKALLLGDTDDIDYPTDTAFKRSGIRHIIAVSGLHVTILFSLVYVLTGRRKWMTALLGLPVLFLFAAVAGFSPSITRACIMHGLMVIGMLFHKEYDPPTALAFAVLCMLLANPWSVVNVSLQLSVGCMAGILAFSDRIKQYLLDKKRLGRLRGIWKKAGGWIASGVSVSLSACVFTTPLCAYYFGIVSLIGPVTNLLTLWIISFIYYGIMVVCAVGAMIPAVGSLIALVLSWPIRYVLVMAKLLSAMPLAAVYTQSIYVVCWLIFVYILLAVFMLAKRKYPLHLGCFATMGLLAALTVSWVEPTLDDCRVTVVDVGQGQCILLQSQGKHFLVDCGSYSDTYAADRAAGLLLSQGITRLDGIILTHFDEDHAGGVVNLLTSIPADLLFMPNCPDLDATGQSIYAYTGGQVITVENDLELTFGTAKITMIPSENAVSSNENGLCILFQTEKCDILITGDRSAAGERELLRHMTLPDLEVLIVGHHGSKTSTCRELLIKTKPDIAIISVGADNSYGHPTQEVLDRLTYYGCRIYRTDLDGTVTFRG